MRVRCEELEQDRKYNVARANELQDTLSAFQSNEVHEALVKKSMQIAEVSLEMDQLNGKIRNLLAENQRIKQERDLHKKMLLELSAVVRSLECSSCDDDESDEDKDDEQDILTQEKAFHLTLKNMRFQIESLERERQKLAVKCKSQAKTISNLRRDNELLEVRMEMLEELLRSQHR